MSVPEEKVSELGVKASAPEQGATNVGAMKAEQEAAPEAVRQSWVETKLGEMDVSDPFADDAPSIENGNVGEPNWEEQVSAKMIGDAHEMVFPVTRRASP